MVVGQLLGAVALGQGGLALAEPLLSANLLFALVFGAAMGHRRPCRRDVAGAVALTAGLAGFLVAASPGAGHTGNVPAMAWVASIGAVVVAAVVLASIGRMHIGRVRGATLAGAAGILFGLQDALTQTTLNTAKHGLGSVFTSWSPYTLVTIAVVGLLLSQSAFQAAPLAASLPPVTAAEPITGISLGVGLFAGSINHQPAALAIEALCLLLLVLGIWVLAASPTHDVPAKAVDAHRG
jgi:hypothetical protein